MTVKPLALDHCLVKAVLDEITELPSESLKDLCVIVPNYRLGAFIQSALAKSKGALFAPDFLSFQQFIDTLATRFPAGRLLSSEASELLLTYLIDSSKYKHIFPGHEHEILQLLGDMFGSGQWPHGFDQLLEGLELDTSKSEASLALYTERFIELKELALRFLSELTDLNLFFKPAYEQKKAEYISEALEKNPGSLLGQGLYKGKSFIFCGLTTVLPIYQPILKSFAKLAKSSFILSKPPDLPQKNNPIQEVMESLAVSVPKQSLHGGNASYHCIKTESPLFEVLASLNYVEELISLGVAPSKVALVLTNETTYGQLVIDFVSRFNIDINTAVSLSLEKTVLGRFITSLRDIVEKSGELGHFLRLWTHPYMLKAGEDGEFSRLEVEAALVRAKPHQEVAKVFAELSETLSLRENVKVACEHFFVRKVKQAPLTHWLKSLHSLLEALEFRNPQFYLQDDHQDGWVRSTLEAYDLAFANLLELAEVFESIHLTKEISLNEFILHYIPKLLRAEIRSVGDPLKGVQVVSLEESRYIPFEHMFVLGCVEGVFPKRLPNDSLLDDYMKTRMGLKGWDYLEAMEATSFATFVQRVPNVYFSYPESVGGLDAVRSRYVDQLFLKHPVKELEVNQNEILKKVGFLNELVVQNEGTGSANCKYQHSVKITPQRLAFTSKLSATSLGKLIRCPQQFLWNRLKVDEPIFPEFESSLQIGALLHKIMEYFFRGKSLATLSLKPLEAGLSRNDLLDRLDRISKEVLDDYYRQTWLWPHLKYFAWPRFVDYHMRLYPESQQTKPIQAAQEYGFGRDSDVIFAYADTKHVAIEGYIDIYQNIDGIYLITDYKLNSFPPPEELKYSLSPQLALYAEAIRSHHNLDSFDKIAVGYWSLLKGEWNFVAGGPDAFRMLSSKGLPLPAKYRDSYGLQTKRDHLAGALDFRLTPLLEANQGFYPDVSYCGFCPMDGVCRRDDPRFIKELSEITPYLDFVKGEK